MCGLLYQMPKLQQLFLQKLGTRLVSKIVIALQVRVGDTRTMCWFFNDIADNRICHDWTLKFLSKSTRGTSLIWFSEKRMTAVELRKR